MPQRSAIVGRTAISIGFVVIAAGGFVEIGYSLSQGIHASWAYWEGVCGQGLPAVGELVVAGAWVWLTRSLLAGDAVGSATKRGLVAYALASLLVSAGALGVSLEITHYPAFVSTTWILIGFAVEGFGALVASLGFVVFAASMSTSSQIAAEHVDTQGSSLPAPS